MVVVDALALAALVFRDEQADVVHGVLRNQDLHAPNHFALEMTNATLMRCRRAPARAPQLIEALSRVLSTPLAMHQVPAIDVLALALRTAHR